MTFGPVRSSGFKLLINGTVRGYGHRASATSEDWQYRFHLYRDDTNGYPTSAKDQYGAYHEVTWERISTETWDRDGWKQRNQSTHTNDDGAGHPSNPMGHAGSPYSYFRAFEVVSRSIPDNAVAALNLGGPNPFPSPPAGRRTANVLQVWPVSLGGEPLVVYKPGYEPTYAADGRAFVASFVHDANLGQYVELWAFIDPNLRLSTANSSFAMKGHSDLSGIQSADDYLAWLRDLNTWGPNSRFVAQFVCGGIYSQPVGNDTNA